MPALNWADGVARLGGKLYLVGPQGHQDHLNVRKMETRSSAFGVRH